jgi:7-cyano-7-deazaguanine synthase in queuosine biosynthesis
MELMRYVGTRGCVADGYAEALSAKSRVVIDTLPKRGNSIIRFTLNEKPLSVIPDARTRDFLDLAASVYIADELELREKAPDGWTRTMDFFVPVKEPAVWEGATEVLRRTLTQLAGDSFAFSWAERSSLPLIGRHRLGVPRGFDAVCLFSGGIDSLLGAYRLIAEGKRVLLVGHQADGTTADAQKKLLHVIRQHFPTKAALIQCRVSRSSIESPRFPLPKKVEETHRPRSFLFLAIAVTIARAARIKEIYIPENGLIALNSSLQISRVGSLSTRTAHPIYLKNFLDLVRSLGVYDGAIRNPFLYESKTDMLGSLEPQLRELVSRSVSCARPSRFKQMKVRHCGYCVPCIYRRIAMMSAGLDQPTQYAFDVFTRVGELSEHQQADFRALVAFAKRVVNTSQLGREMIVLAHGPFPPELGGLIGPYAASDYSPWTDMMLRWAEDFLDKVRRTATPDALTLTGLSGAVRGATV